MEYHAECIPEIFYIAVGAQGWVSCSSYLVLYSLYVTYHPVAVPSQNPRKFFVVARDPEIFCSLL